MPMTYNSFYKMESILSSFIMEIDTTLEMKVENWNVAQTFTDRLRI